MPAFAERLRAADVDAAGGPPGVALLDRVPVLSKDDLVARQSAEPPFGGLLAAAARVRRVFQSPGPLYEPELDEPDPWGWAPALAAAGFEAGDVVLNTFAYHLSPAGAMFEAAAYALGCVVVPAGVGSFDLQVRAARDAGATAYIGLPSYLKALLERAEEQDVLLALRRAFVTAEPLPPSLREWLRSRVPVVQQGYGTAEAGNLGYECERMSGLHVPEDRYVQVCDLRDGQPRWGGEEGQVVVSLLSADYPLVRLGTGDLSAFLDGTCPCGRWTPRLAGWLGRVGEAVKVRGMFLHPRQARSVMAGVPGSRPTASSSSGSSTRTTCAARSCRRLPAATWWSGSARGCERGCASTSRSASSTPSTLTAPRSSTTAPGSSGKTASSGQGGRWGRWGRVLAPFPCARMREN